MKHYKEKLSAYLHHELPKEERQTIAAHLLQCESCRKEHDEIKLGVALASKLDSFDAPPNVWNEIVDNLDGRTAPNFSFIQQKSFFNRRGWMSLATSCAIVFVSLLALFKFNFFDRTPLETATNPPQTTSSSNRTTETSDQSSPFSQAGWKVETLAGESHKSLLAVGETLETDEFSRARITVANIGNVEVSPNSRIKLVNTESTEHRLSLEQGKLQAMIYAPPRLFIVDTPSAVAVDLGCAYTLEVDKKGNSKLHVTSGYVALERDGRESIVPSGAIALTKKGKGLGTPYYEEVSMEFQKALYKFDFEKGGADALKTIVNESCNDASLTLWHLLFRTTGKDRELVFETLNKFVKLPDGATKEGILKLDKKMLELWEEKIGIRFF